jgi:hypothetical protein
MARDAIRRPRRFVTIARCASELALQSSSTAVVCGRANLCSALTSLYHAACLRRKAARGDESQSSALRSMNITGATYERRRRPFPIRSTTRSIGTLADLEARFPALASPESPTQKVADPAGGFRAVTHRAPMLS